MAGLKYDDRVMEMTATTGTATVTLAGAVPDFQPFSAVFATGDQVYYLITDNATNWEEGLGTYTLSGTTLSRDKVLRSSNAGALVSFATGTKYVFVTQPAQTTADIALTAAFAQNLVGF